MSGGTPAGREPGERRRFAAARLLRPVQAFVQTEASSGILLLAAAVAAIAWANSPWKGSYADLWAAKLALDANLFAIEKDLGHLVNDGLMAIFFFVVGLEIKRELLQGELASVRRAALPVAAAIGGMVAPAGIFAALNLGHAGAKGWGIPMATDIAFSLGVLALLGRRVPFTLKIFLLALAIVDDLGAILVIALFYTEAIAGVPLLWAGAALAALVALQRLGVRSAGVYVALGFLFWAAVLESGIHATLAGVVLAFLTPAGPAPGRAADAEGAQPEESPLARIERQLHPWVSYGIVPVFALANAGVAVGAGSLGDALGSRVTAGIVLGLVLGKPIGICLASLLVLRLGIASLPANVRFAQLWGMGMLAGIGFTVSLFITGLAYAGPELVAEAKIGVLGASLIAGSAAFAYLRLVPAAAAAPGLAERRDTATASSASPGRS